MSLEAKGKRMRIPIDQKLDLQQGKWSLPDLTKFQDIKWDLDH